MVVNEPRDLNIKENGSGSATQSSTSNPWGAGDKPKTIWTGMKKSDAEKYNLLDEFNRANTDPDDTISEQEYNAFISKKDEPKDITSNSGKRVAVGGVYTVVKGDTLSKIAKDFNVDVYELYRMNRSEIGGNINVLKVGQKITIKKADVNTHSSVGTEHTDAQEGTTTSGNNNHKLKPLVLSNSAKAALSQALGVDVSSMSPDELAQKAVSMDIEKLMKCFQIVMKSSNSEDLENLMSVLTNDDTVATTIISTARNLDTPEKMEQLVSQMSKALNIKPEDLKKLSITDVVKQVQGLDKGTKTKLVKEVLIKTLGDAQAIHTAFKGHTGEISQADFDNFYGISDEIRNEKNPQKRMDLIVEAIGKRILQDMNLNDSESYVSQVLKDIEAGNLTDYERKAFADKNLKDPDVQKQIALQRVRNAHTNIFASAMTEDIINDNLQEFQVKLQAYVSDAIQDAFGDTKDNGVLAALSATVADSDDTPDEYKESISNIIAENSKQLGVDNLDDAFFRAVTNSIYKHGSEDSLNQYTNDNSERIGVIIDIIKNIQSNSTDSARTNILNNVLSTATYVQQNGSSGNASSTNYNYASNPISSSYANEVAALRESYETLYGNQIQADEETVVKTRAKSEELSHLNLIRQQAAQSGINIAEFKNMPLGKAMSELISHFNEMPEKIKNHFTNHLIQFANTHSDLACEAYIQGDDQLKQFMNKHKIVTQDDVFKYFDEHEEQIKYAPATLQVAYYKHVSEQRMQS